MEVVESHYFYESLSHIVHKEYSPSGSPYAEFYVGPNNRVVSQKMFGYHGRSIPGHDPILKTTGGLMYYHYDGMSSVSELTNRHGDIIERYRYDAFGGIMTGITAPYNTNSYTGHTYDQDAGLIDMRARVYDANIGRFLQEDTYAGMMQNPLSQNRYAYVMNDPVNYWDPTGRIPQEIYNGGGTLGSQYSGVPSWVVNRQSHSQRTDTPDGFIEERWRYQGFLREITTGVLLIDEKKNQREIVRTYGVGVLDTWYYLYDQDRITYINDREAQELERLIIDESVRFQGRNTAYWTETISAEHLMYANYEELARFGEPTSQEVALFQRQYINNYFSDLYQLSSFNIVEFIKQNNSLYSFSIRNDFGKSINYSDDELLFINEKFTYTYKDSEYTGSAWKGNRIKVVGTIEIVIEINGKIRSISKSLDGNQLSVELPDGQNIHIDLQDDSISYSLIDIEKTLYSNSDIGMDIELKPVSIGPMEDGYIKVSEGSLVTSREYSKVKYSINRTIEVGLKKEDYDRQLETGKLLLELNPILVSDWDIPEISFNIGPYGTIRVPVYNIPEVIINPRGNIRTKPTLRLRVI